ncbi:MAG: glycosyltransferase family 2 protein [Planctomycetes bacterium]|nr:glycosyltransferase family 2 protein [Planctomycetota bacterium]
MRPAVLIPNYNNAHTLGDVVSRALDALPDVLVIDDGSTDSSASVLDHFRSRIRSERHAVNRGKGAALKTGFAALAAAGFTHAIALDADGQHFPEDLPAMLAESRAHPDALVIGVRDMQAAGAPRKSRFGLACANTALRLFTGVRCRDTQSGFRSYPLPSITALPLHGDRYDLEMEVLFAAARAGIAIREVPIRVTYTPEGGRVTHFRPVRDFVQIAGRVARTLRSRAR